MAKHRIPARRIVALIAIATIVAAAVTYLREERKPKPLVLTGTLEARTVNVGSLVGGRVSSVHVEEGQSVTPGALIVSLETDTLDREIIEQRTAIEAARAQLAKALAGPRVEEIRRAEAIHANAEREWRRFAVLHENGIVSRQMLDDAVTKAKTAAQDLRLLKRGTRKEDIDFARAQLAQQEARLAELQKRRAETVVRSSVAGRVQSFGLRPGDIVAPNQTVAELLEPSQVWVRIYVPETLLGHVRVNMPVRVRVDTFPDLWFNGQVASVASEGEYTPRNVQTRAQRAEQVFGVKVVVNPDPKLKAGMAAEVDLRVRTRAQ